MKRLQTLFLKIAGALFFAVGIGYFINASNTAPGGVSGIALILHHLFAFPIGVSTLLINIPILVWGYVSLNKRLILNSLGIIILCSVFLDVVSEFFPPFTGDRLLGAIFGGLLTGLGMGLIFRTGGTTGGTDILSYIMRKKHPSVKIGTAILIIDLVIILLSMLAYRELDAGLYGIIALYSTTKIIDALLYGSDGGSVVMIVSDKAAEISDYITVKMERGITMWNCRGGYSSNQHSLIMCAVRKRQLTALRLAVKAIDRKAFMICMRSSDIYGEGFESIS